MGLTEAIKRIAETGEIAYGSRATADAIAAGTAKAVLIAHNCPARTRARLATAAAVAGIPTLVTPTTAAELGALCGKPFLVAAAAVLATGGIALSDLTGGKA